MRLDAALVKRGLASTRSEATRLIESGLVTVSGSYAHKAARLVGPEEPILVVSQPRFVSRGGEKLEGALIAMAVPIEGRSVMDVGASTGGFTDCLLQHGARRVFAVDVGQNQMHERVRNDPRVISMEGVNIRDFDPLDVPFACSLLVADLSFISLTKVAHVLIRCVRPEEAYRTPELLLLVKPQFEVGRVEASRGRGVITDPDLHDSAVKGVRETLESLGVTVGTVVESAIKGAEGNTEFFLLARVGLESLGCPT